MTSNDGPLVSIVDFWTRKQNMDIDNLRAIAPKNQRKLRYGGL